MSESWNPERENGARTAGKGKSAAQTIAPYETALNKALDKLTSQIFIFLLAYTILLIGLTVFGRGIPADMRNLLYVIPVLGVVTYGWLMKRTVIRDPQAKGIRVRAGVVGSRAYVGGVHGAGQVSLGDVDVAGGIISGSVVGVDQGNRRADTPSQFLLSVFEKPGEDDQNDLMQHALELQRKRRLT